MQKIYARYIKQKEALWTAIFTGLLTACTILLVQIGCQANRTTAASQRAFVNFQTVQPVDRVLSPTNGRITHVRFAVAWNNSGTTPAVRVHGRINFLPIGSELQKG